MYLHRYIALDRYWEVGYFDPHDEWIGVRDCETDREAIDLVAKLNGGTDGSQTVLLFDDWQLRGLIATLVHCFVAPKLTPDQAVCVAESLLSEPR
jgi:hypothetical protein